MRFQNILCAVDFSETSRTALHLAIDVARTYGATLTIAHIFDPPMYPLPEGGLLPDLDAEERLRLATEEALERWRSEAERRGAPSVTTASSRGAAWQEIVRLARERACDLVVLGTHGRTGLKHLAIGSVAERVVRHCTSPVLTVRQPD